MADFDLPVLPRCLDVVSTKSWRTGESKKDLDGVGGIARQTDRCYNRVGDFQRLVLALLSRNNVERCVGRSQSRSHTSSRRTLTRNVFSSAYSLSDGYVSPLTIILSMRNGCGLYAHII